MSPPNFGPKFTKHVFRPQTPPPPQIYKCYSPGFCSLCIQDASNHFFSIHISCCFGPRPPKFENLPFGKDCEILIRWFGLLFDTLHACICMCVHMYVHTCICIMYIHAYTCRVYSSPRWGLTVIPPKNLLFKTLTK